VLQRFPSLDAVRFTNSGTEANLMALALATAVTGRSRVLVFGGAYHGGVLAFAGGVSSPVNVPHDWVIGTYNDTEATRSLIREHAGSIAAVLVEPMLGSGGAIRGDHAFLAMLREEATRAGALLILDEVMTSRLAPGGFQRTIGVRPDLTTFGKYLGGGMSFGAFGGRADLMLRFDPSQPGALAHAGTFNNNVLTMAAGIAGLRDVLDDAALVALNARGDGLREALNRLLETEDVAMQATGVGSILTLHLTDAAVRSPADLVGENPRLKQLLFLDLVADGFWIATRGMLALSLPVSDADCDAFVAAVGAFVERRRGLLAHRGD
jgi:glutamate-1-semialdehyde 2,1-aminomutase